MEYRLTDRFNRDLGDVSHVREIDGGLAGRLSPGSDFAEVETLFAEYDALVTGRSTVLSHKKMLDRLSEIQPRLIRASDGSAKQYFAAIVTEVPKGLLLTLVEGTD